METATSADGTTIAYERTGSGPALILVAGALTGRAEMRPLAEALSGAATVVNYDRRSRGDSGDAQTAVPETAEREIEDVAALAAAVGDAGGGRVPWDLLPEVACPTLVMAGSETFPFMLEVAETLARGLPRADRLVIPGADHESGPDLIAPPVRAFLAG